MSLAVEVGTLADLIENDEEGAEWFRESISQVNEVLREQGLQEHLEPENLPRIQFRCSIGSYPYSFLHHLRRFYAHCVADPSWSPQPTPPGENPADDPVVDSETNMMSSHLLCHSDCEGFYLPIDFKDVIIDEKSKDRVVGGLLGSSYRLKEELTMIAPKLGIRLENRKLSDSEVDRLNKAIDAEATLWIEKTVWLSLYEAACFSIEHRTAVCFT